MPSRKSSIKIQRKKMALQESRRRVLAGLPAHSIRGSLIVSTQCVFRNMRAEILRAKATEIHLSRTGELPIYTPKAFYRNTQHGHLVAFSRSFTEWRMWAVHQAKHHLERNVWSLFSLNRMGYLP